MSIPLDANFKSMSCQLGGLRLNGIVNYSDQSPSPPITTGTAQSLTVITIDDPAVAQDPPVPPDGSIWGNSLKGSLQVQINNTTDPSKYYYIPLYQ